MKNVTNYILKNSYLKSLNCKNRCIKINKFIKNFGLKIIGINTTFLGIVIYINIRKYKIYIN